MIWQLTDDPCLWPDPHTGEEDGFIAVGGDLSPQRLYAAYSLGFFPWYSYRLSKTIHWYCPLRRFVIFPSEIHVSHSMRQLIAKDRYEVTFNEAFDQVIRHCATADGRDGDQGAWLGEHIIRAYTEMHMRQLALSVEVWERADDGCECRLVGGLYGLFIGHGFIGESMFSLVPSASKLALIMLARRLEPLDMIIDCQLETPHLKSMGGRFIPYEEYIERIR